MMHVSFMIILFHLFISPMGQGYTRMRCLLKFNYYIIIKLIIAKLMMCCPNKFQLHEIKNGINFRVQLSDSHPTSPPQKVLIVHLLAAGHFSFIICVQLESRKTYKCNFFLCAIELVRGGIFPLCPMRQIKPSCLPSELSPMPYPPLLGRRKWNPFRPFKSLSHYKNNITRPPVLFQKSGPKLERTTKVAVPTLPRCYSRKVDHSVRP